MVFLDGESHKTEKGFAAGGWYGSCDVELHVMFETQYNGLVEERQRHGSS
jgi:hypothetical protein